MNPNDILMHVGVGHDDDPPGRGSGRYGYGSGENPYQHGVTFYDKYNRYKHQGLSEVEIAEKMNARNMATGQVSTVVLRKMYSMAVSDFKASYKVAQAQKAVELRDKGLSYDKIAAQMGLPGDSSVRHLISSMDKYKTQQHKVTAQYLVDRMEKTGKFLEVGDGAQYQLNVSRGTLDNALAYLQMQGYSVYNRRRPNATNKSVSTTLMILTPPGTERKLTYDDKNMTSVIDFDDQSGKKLINGGKDTRKIFEYPESLNSKRLQILYKEDGGEAKDGLIEIRPGVKDLSLGEGVNYAQARILVNGTHYLKGMAVYSNDLPDGIDVRFNSNKSKEKGLEGALKEIERDKKTGEPLENPFGAVIKRDGGQTYYDDPKGRFVDPDTGKKQSLGLVNKPREEGDWNDWSDKVPSQFLSKQPKEVIKKQLDLTKKMKAAEFDEINELTNPTIKQYLLEKYADTCDGDSVKLKAISFPSQKYKVLIPVKSLKDNEIYAPHLEDGTEVVLVRYPHEGRFQIPRLKVNNHNKEAQAYIGKVPKDAVCINKNVADILSGADFDGDTVQVIPVNDKVRLANKEPLKDLEGFDAKEAYGPSTNPFGYNIMKKEQVQQEMGKASNLITDMTLKGAKDEELARAVKYSMTVIDAKKHKLDWQRCAKEQGIDQLRRVYQNKVDAEGNQLYDQYGKPAYGAASTLISKSSGQDSAPKTVGGGHTDPVTGKKVYKIDDSIQERTKPRRKVDPETGKYMKDENGKYIYEINPKTGRPYRDPTGKYYTPTRKTTKMANTDDAYTLVSEYRTPAELLYADYANFNKAMANKARLAALNTSNLTYNKEAAKTYKKEVDSLNTKLLNAEKNKSREKEAQRRATIVEKDRLLNDPRLWEDEKQLKKIRDQALAQARAEVGAKRNPIDIEPKEWEAIQAGAITHTKLKSMLKYTDLDKLREYASPHGKGKLNTSQINLIRTMAKGDYSLEEIAKRLGISASTVSNYL